MPDLSTSYLGLKLKNPIVIASSGLTDSVEKIKELEANGAAAVVLKSIFEEEIIMEMDEKMLNMTGRPFIYPETFDYMNDEPEEDLVRKYLRLIKEAKAAVSIPIIASINCVSSQKWIYLASEIEKAGADALEINFFVLPTDLNRSVDENENIYYEVLKEVKKKVSLPVSLKISAYHSNLAHMVKTLDQSGADGIVMFNRFYSPDIDIDNLTLNTGQVLSGAYDFKNTLRWVGILRDRVSCSIAATTGIHSSESIIKQLLAGADVVELASIIYKEGPGYIDTLTKEIYSWMEKQGFENISDFQGRLSQDKSNDPAAFERVQFMKHFRHFVM
ncbi:dihydroorotate dehydrogenase-like protein [Ancylomarina sp. 16SWW S1-10-2]|uniref:dihydroorotate dehydrogenase-like protein n=1 Tax=Ancylomarina sp. 16SWW S1-10-2 TaxID=2499681 RepID=UPI0012AE24EC|nr:dihydroorotate dehydrogenase-like protein [Ancylomarina sp. 16SWW S1-10-2]MRT92291.1 dihydroorotate dehydrogenase-like protein [Ancylomarina sp. 16SWW S1-10-2]